jgi:hypothetical protein
MTNTKALRQQILGQIAELKEKLRAIDMVERMSRDLKAKGKPKPPTAPSKAEAGETLAGPQSLIDVCQSALTDEWQSVRQLSDWVLAKKPDAKMAPINTAFVRLHQRGRAEKRGGSSRKDVTEYRRKQ